MIDQQRYHEFMNNIADHPEDWSAYLIFGDWLEEQEEEQLSRGYRWLGRNRKSPVRRYRTRTGLTVAGKFQWAWRLLQPNGQNNHCDFLPHLVFHALPGYRLGKTHIYYGSREQAITHLSEALQALHDVLEKPLHGTP